MSYSFDKKGIRGNESFYWANYSNYNGIINSFMNQARNYLQFVGNTINGQVINGVTFCFSSQPPQAVIDALNSIGVTVNWV